MQKKWLDQNIQTDIKHEEDIVTISAVIEAKMDHAWVRISVSLKFAKGVISFPYYTPNATRVARTQVMMIVVNHFGFQETLNLRVHLLHSGTNSFANKEPTSDSCVSISKKIVLSQLFTMHCFMVLKGVLLSANQKKPMALTKKYVTLLFVYTCPCSFTT